MKQASLITACLLLAGSPVQADENFSRTTVHFERTIGDGDAEVRFEAIGGDTGLSALQIAAPDGRIVVEFTAPHSKLGLRQIFLESPEPKDPAKVLADFPEGAYVFTATTVDGAKLVGKAAASHVFPAATSFIRPRADATDVPAMGLQVKWAPVGGLAAVVVVIEQERSGREIRANLPGTATSFAVPDGFLLPGTAYKLAVGTVSPAGNKSVVETEFTTAAKQRAAPRP